MEVPVPVGVFAVRIHPHPRLLEDLTSSLSQELSPVVVEHLAQCASCRQRLEKILGRHPEPLLEKLAEVVPWPGWVEAGYGRAIAAAEMRLLSHMRVLSAERADAPLLLAELLGHPPERREMLMRNHPRFQTWGLFERLIDDVQERGFTDPQTAEELARLALSLADVLDPSYYGAERIDDLRARAWGYIGNARRIRFELRGAEEAFERAEIHLRSGTRDSLERGLLLDLRASLLRDQRQFVAAERLLLRALQIYREVGETHRAGRTLVSLSAVYEQAGTPERALKPLLKALELIDGEREPRVLLIAHHNLITVLAEAGRFMAAQRLLIQARPLYARFSDSRTWHHWVEGRIARGLGQKARAEVHLQAARNGFLTEGAIYDTALVSLELATLYAEQNRTTELKQLAEEILTVFSSRQIHREALAALSFLQQAVLAERASLELVTGVATFLKRLQRDPDLSFVQPAET